MTEILPDEPKPARSCKTCIFWGGKINCIISATIKADVQVCCHEAVSTGVIVTHATDSCVSWESKVKTT